VRWPLSYGVLVYFRGHKKVKADIEIFLLDARHSNRTSNAIFACGPKQTWRDIRRVSVIWSKADLDDGAVSVL
jgi:hypothetical protein